MRVTPMVRLPWSLAVGGSALGRLSVDRYRRRRWGIDDASPSLVSFSFGFSRCMIRAIVDCEGIEAPNDASIAL